jgi:hypothetical protein
MIINYILSILKVYLIISHYIEWTFESGLQMAQKEHVRSIQLEST